MNYYGVTRSNDHLAHYGVKGMKWGVRKALATGNQKALARHYRKAAKKLNKLQDIGLNSKKYAAKSAAYGVAAIGTGTLVTKKALKMYRPTKVKSQSVRGVVESLASAGLNNPTLRVYDGLNKVKKNKAFVQAMDTLKKSDKSVANRNKYLRIGALVGTGAATLGLGAASGVNAYRATHGKKYRAKAVEFKNAMDEAFKGTPYSGSYVVPKRKRRRG